MPDLRTIMASLSEAQRAALALPLPPPRVPGRKPRKPPANGSGKAAGAVIERTAPTPGSTAVLEHWAQPKPAPYNGGFGPYRPRPGKIRGPCQAARARMDHILSVLRTVGPATIKQVAEAAGVSYATAWYTLKRKAKKVGVLPVAGCFKPPALYAA